MAFDLKEIVASRLGENYQLHERHFNALRSKQSTQSRIVPA